MASSRLRYHLFDLVMVIALCGLIAAVVRWVGMTVIQVRRPAPLPGFPTTTFIGMEVAFIAWFVTWKVVRARRSAPECVDCGRRFVPPRKIKGPAICPRCQQRSLSPSQTKREQKRNIGILLIFLAVFTIILSFILSNFVGDYLGRVGWIVLPLISLMVLALSFLGIFALFFIPLFAVALSRTLLMRHEGYALAHARKVAGNEGEVVRTGPFTVWYFGLSDPVPMLMEHAEIARCRFESLLGEKVVSQLPIRIFVFERRDALVAYHRQAATNLWNVDGIYVPGPRRTMTFTTEVVPDRLGDPERTARSLWAFYLLEAYRGFLPRPWLQLGIVDALTGDVNDRALLNGKMVASLTRGTAFGPDLFGLEAKAVHKLVRGDSDHGNFARLTRFRYQAWSLVEFLAGAGAPEERREKFRAFLTEIRPNEPDEVVFERHFGHGFDRLLESWKVWVLDRGIGVYESPPPQVQDALLGRIIPIVQDHRAKIMDRIQAVRAIGLAGHVLGATALIDLLREPGEIPKEEIVWSLEAISGLVLGDDPERWSAWFSELPREAIGQNVDLLPSPVS